MRNEKKMLLHKAIQSNVVIFEYGKKLLLLLLLSLLLISFSAFTIVEEEKLPTQSHTKDKNIKAIPEKTFHLQLKEESWVHAFLDYIPGLREQLFRFKKTDLKKTC